MPEVVVSGFDSFNGADESPEPESEVKVIEDIKIEEEPTEDSVDEIFKVEEEDLSKHVVKSIGSIFSLEPIIVSVLTEENKTIGIPGLFNPETKKFILLDGSNVPCDNFDEQFLKFLNGFDTDKIKKEDQNEQPQES